MRVTFIVIIASVLLSVGCSKEYDLQESSFTYPDTVILSEIGSVSGTDENLFGRPGTVLPLDGGEFIVADNQSLLLHLFDRDLSYLHTFGEIGNGPGEFHH